MTTILTQGVTPKFECFITQQCRLRSQPEPDLLILNIILIKMRRDSQSIYESYILKATLIECANVASHLKNTYFSAQYSRIATRRGKNHAAVAVPHTILTIIHKMLKDNQLQS